MTQHDFISMRDKSMHNLQGYLDDIRLRRRQNVSSDRAYYSACGAAWAYESIGIITKSEATTWTTLFAQAAFTSDPQRRDATTKIKRYYTPKEVSQMTPAQVRENYQVIVDSMKKWN